MDAIPNTTDENEFWSKRYATQNTGWDIGAPSTPLKEYIDQLTDKTLKILIPGAGNAYEAEYLFENGFKHVFVLDVSAHPLRNFAERNPNFPTTQLLHENFFEHKGKYDLILEQTFFCSFPPLPTTRMLYAKQMYDLLKNGGKLVGLWFNFPLTEDLEKRPFGGSKKEYLTYFKPYFKTLVFDVAHNSIQPRQGRELFGIHEKK